MLFVQARNAKSRTATTTLLGTGMRASAIEAGTWVSTIVLMSPIRRAIGAAAMLEVAESTLAMKNMLPSLPSLSLNF